jgi:hypothetical protein
MPVTSWPRRLPVLAAAATTALLLAGTADAALRPPNVWQASTIANGVGANLAGHFDADSMGVFDCDRTGRLTRTCSVNAYRSGEETYSDCTWKVAVTRTRRGLRQRTGKATCGEYSTPFGKPTQPRAQRRSKARAFRIASRVAVARARAISADDTYVRGCETHRSTDRVCQVGVSHGGRGGGATCQSLVIVPPIKSRRPVRTLSLGPCTAN